jgi:hypothetical protein
MSPSDLLRFALRALVGHRLRSALSLLGVSIGVAAVVVLTALGDGARRYVTNQFAAIGSNILIVFPGKTETTGGMPGFGGVPHDLTLDDAVAIRHDLIGVEKLAPSPGHGDRRPRWRRRQAVVGTHEMMEIRHLSVAAGATCRPGRWAAASRWPCWARPWRKSSPGPTRSGRSCASGPGACVVGVTATAASRSASTSTTSWCGWRPYAHLNGSLLHLHQIRSPSEMER